MRIAFAIEKIQLSISEMLVWYDGPQLFTAMDIEGNEYLCFVYGQTEDGDSVLTMATSSNFGTVFA